MTARLTSLCLAIACSALLPSCGGHKTDNPTGGHKNTFKNPYPAGTYDNFKADPSYPRTYNVWRDVQKLAEAKPEETRILISVSKQRGFLMKGEDVLLDYPICSGREGHETPEGRFHVLEKTIDKRSNRYGRLYDADGNCVNTDPDMTKDKIPEGGRFEGAEMHYWLRITWDGIGHHVGPIKRYPASHSCIRGPSAVMPLVFDKVKIGTPLTVEP